MSDRGNIVENSRPEEGGQREWLRAAAPAMARFLLGFLLAAGRFAGTMAPFGTALVAHSGTGLGGLGALSGACLGYLATGGLDWGIRYAAACVLAFTLSFIIGEERMETSPWIAPCSAFAVTAATGALGRLAGGMGDVGVAAEAIARINASGYLAVVVTNQPVLARGECTAEELDAIFCRMETELGRRGAYVDAVYYCPHHPDRGFAGEVPELKTDCACRKPKPGLLLCAAEELHIDLAASWSVGDSWRDVEAGKRAGTRTALLICGEPLRGGEGADLVCADLAEAVGQILGLTEEQTR